MKALERIQSGSLTSLSFAAATSLPPEKRLSNKMQISSYQTRLLAGDQAAVNLLTGPQFSPSVWPPPPDAQSHLSSQNLSSGLCFLGFAHFARDMIYGERYVSQYFPPKTRSLDRGGSEENEKVLALVSVLGQTIFKRTRVGRTLLLLRPPV